MSVAQTVNVQITVQAPETMEVYASVEPLPYLKGRPLHIVVCAYLRPVAAYEDLKPCPNALVRVKKDGVVIARGVTDETGVFVCDYTPEETGTITLTVEVASYEQAG